MRDDNNPSKFLISVAEALVSLFVALILLLALLYLLLVLISDVEGINEFQKFAVEINDILTDSSEIMISLLTISVATLALAFLVIFVCWLSKDEKGIIILPFEVPAGEKKYSGKALSHLLTTELLRIHMIHKTGSEGISPVESEQFNFPILVPTSENPSFTITQMGPIGFGTTSIHLGPFMEILKRLWPWGDHGKLISGSLQQHEKAISLVACIEHHDVKAWEASKIEDGNDDGREIVQELARDLAFKIVQGFSRDGATSENITAKTWQGFKHFTEALDAYRLYNLTGHIDHLERSRTECLKAATSEIGYVKLLDLLYNLGVAYSNKKDFSKAEDLLNQAIRTKSDYHPALLMLGYLYGIQDQNEKALIYFDIVLKINPDNVYALYGKGIASGLLGDPKKSLESFDKLIELDQENVDALNYKGDVLLGLRKHEEALECFESVINIINKYNK